ncbi:hypothetical protein AALP_AA3G194200 [Arabis alpina]|uniref:Pectinesterase inhibitor domain-containing protein n=1 Tax=Arabis alpina TaxID=50452 RepID=A0A087HA98_ARAAL|nr:hypothetical protein AALP_AA3G194200 [Arabis alpina]
MIKMMMMMMIAMMIGVVVGDFVDKTCKQTPHYTLCLSLLRSDPSSSTANTAGLSLFLVDKIKALGITTLRHIDRAYEMKPMLKRPLDKCNSRYKRIVGEYVKTAITAIKGNPKFAEGAIASFSIEASLCEEGFAKELIKPVHEEGQIWARSF